MIFCYIDFLSLYSASVVLLPGIFICLDNIFISSFDTAFIRLYDSLSLFGVGRALSPPAFPGSFRQSFFFPLLRLLS